MITDDPMIVSDYAAIVGSSVIVDLSQYQHYMRVAYKTIYGIIKYATGVIQNIYKWKLRILLQFYMQ